MKTLLVGFGDSWTFGSELDRPQEQSWIVPLSHSLSAEYINLGVPASSIGHLIVQLFDYIKVSNQYTDYKKIFMIGLTGTTRYLSYSNRLNEFVNITPAATYQTRNIKHSGSPPDVVLEFSNLSGDMYRMVECSEYNTFLATQTIFSFQQYCYSNNIDCIFFSYFDYIKLDNQILDLTQIYPTSLTYSLTGHEFKLPLIQQNKYFKGNLFHPNLLGHLKIAEILNEFYNKKYSRN